MGKKRKHPHHPLAEVFGFPWDDSSEEAVRHRRDRLYPFNNRVPSRTKDKVNDPLGVCSIYENNGKTLAITCPIRFREQWLITADAAKFFFGDRRKWTSLTEVRLDDREGQSAGNIDVVLVSYDDTGKLLDFGAVEIQSVYISGNVRRPFEAFMKDNSINLDWRSEEGYPRADYLSSSRKRLVPQLLYKGSILASWKKKIAVVVHKEFFQTLPRMRSCGIRNAEVAWLVYDLVYNGERNRYQLTKYKTCYPRLSTVLAKVAKPKPGSLTEFQEMLQDKLDERLGGHPSDALSLGDILGRET